MLLQAFYSIRSERQLMERLEFDLLFRWFVGIGVDDAAWDHSTFSKNRERLLEGDIAAKLLSAVLSQPRVKRLLSTDHFSVDGTLIEAWASAKPVTPVTPAAPTPQKRRFGLAPLAAALVALLVVIAGGAWWLLNADRPASIATKAPAEAVRLSIVVLPFANLSGDPGQDYLADALTDELTTALARIRDGFVIARNTAMTFKGKSIDAKAIGKDLGVRYVLEGSVQQSGDRMRVSAQLIDAGSGAHLWAEQFDTPRADLLQTQDAIVARLANTLNFQLIYAEGARANRTPAANRDAEDLALQCSAGQFNAGPIGKEADAAYALCQQALAIDPNNVRALTALGVKFWLPAALGLSRDPKGDLERADELEFEGARPRSK